MRVVLDTNILISACLKPGGLEANLVTLAISGRLTACASPAVLTEYQEVLFRPKFAGVRGVAGETLSSLERALLIVHPTATVRVSPDEDDNRFLECASAAHADFLVSGNLRHYPLSWGDTRIVNARQFFELNSIR